jgi:hypothetical protein
LTANPTLSSPSFLDNVIFYKNRRIPSLMTKLVGIRL